MFSGVIAINSVSATRSLLLWAARDDPVLSNVQLEIDELGITVTCTKCRNICVNRTNSEGRGWDICESNSRASVS